MIIRVRCGLVEAGEHDIGILIGLRGRVRAIVACNRRVARSTAALSDSEITTCALTVEKLQRGLAGKERVHVKRCERCDRLVVPLDRFLTSCPCCNSAQLAEDAPPWQLVLTYAETARLGKVCQQALARAEATLMKSAP